MGNPYDEEPRLPAAHVSDDAVYSAIASRRTQWDNLTWQVPVLSLTAQSFLFTIALGADTSRIGRSIAAILSLVVTATSIHLMLDHRRAEIADAHWLADMESTRPVPAHGLSFREHRNRTDVFVSYPGARTLLRVRSIQVWLWGLSIFGLAALLVLVLVLFSPGVLS